MHYDDEDSKPPAPGALPSPSKPHEWEAFLAKFNANRKPFYVVGGICLAFIVAAVFFATRSIDVAKNATVQAPQQPLSVAVTPASHDPAQAPAPNAVLIDQYGNPIISPSAPPPPGVDPVQWQKYQAWQAGCPNGNCESKSGKGEASALSPAQQRAQEHQKKMEDLMWAARISSPDAGLKKRVEAQPVSVEQPKPTSQPGLIPPTGPESEAPLVTANTCKPLTGQTYRLLAGLSIIKARLINAITGENRGPVLAQTVQPTYNFDMTKVLIPKGAYLIGNYDRVAELDQERILLGVTKIIMPDGCRIEFKEVDVLDQSGMEGLRDIVKNHYAQMFLTSIAVAGIGASAQIGGGGGYGYSPVDVLRVGFGQGSSNAAQQIFSRFANRRKTLIIRAGQEIDIFPPVDFGVAAWGDHQKQPA